MMEGGMQEAGDFRLKPRLHRTRNRKFESISLHRRVCELSVPKRRKLLVGCRDTQRHANLTAR